VRSAVVVIPSKVVDLDGRRADLYRVVDPADAPAYLKSLVHFCAT
jgi:hypothetical protein